MTTTDTTPLPVDAVLHLLERHETLLRRDVERLTRERAEIEKSLAILALWESRRQRLSA